MVQAVSASTAQAALEAVALRCADRVAVRGLDGASPTDLSATQACASLCLSVAVGCAQEQLTAAAEAGPAGALAAGSGLAGFALPFTQAAGAKRFLVTAPLTLTSLAEVAALLTLRVGRAREAARSWQRALASSTALASTEPLLAVAEQLEQLLCAEVLPLHTAVGVCAYAQTLMAVAGGAEALSDGCLQALGRAHARYVQAGGVKGVMYGRCRAVW